MEPPVMSGGISFSNVEMLDEVAAGITPDPEAPLHVNPYDAAKTIRSLAKSLRLAVAATLTKTPTNVAQGKAYLEHTISRVQNASNSNEAATARYYDKIEPALQRLRQQLAVDGELYTAIKERKSMEGRRLLELRHLEVHQLTQDSAAVLADIRNARQYLNRALEYGGISQGHLVASPGGENAEAQKAEVQRLCDEIHKLAQGLPTIANGPVEKNQMILRAIATLLKNGGFLSTSITTEGEHDPT